MSAGSWKPLLVGIAGGYCSGKNAAMDYLSGLGFACVDADKLGHEALARCSSKIAAEFGSRVMDPDGAVDRKALGALVFKSKSALAKLEDITFPEIFSLLEEWLSVNEGRDRCVNAWGLYKIPWVGRFDAVMEITAALPVRIARGMKRDGLPPLEILRRIRSQGRSLRARGGIANVTLVDNSRDADSLRRRIDAVLSTARKAKGAIPG